MKQRTILLIDDNPADAELTQIAFEPFAATARFVVLSNGEEAIDYLSRRGAYPDAPPPNLVLLDLNLPRVGGLDVLATIKSLEETRQIPVIVLTSSEARDDIVRSYRAGANCYLTKPFEPTAHREMARRLHDFWLDLAKLPLPETETPESTTFQ